MSLTIYTPEHYKADLQNIYNNIQKLKDNLKNLTDGQGSDALNTSGKKIDQIESDLDTNLKGKLSSEFGLSLDSNDKIQDLDKVKVDITALKEDSPGNYSEIDAGNILQKKTTDLTDANLKDKERIGAKVDADGDGTADKTAVLDIDVKSYTSALEMVSDYEKTMKTLEENLKTEIDSLKTKVNDTSNSYIDNAVSQLKAQKTSTENALGTISTAVDNYIKVAIDGDSSGGKESFKTMVGASDGKFSTLKQTIKNKIKNIMDFGNTNSDNTVTLKDKDGKVIKHKLTIAERLEKINLLVMGGEDKNGLFGTKNKKYHGYIEVLGSYLDMKNNQSSTFNGLKSELDKLNSTLQKTLGKLKSQYGAIISGGDSQISIKSNSGKKEFELTKKNLEKLNGKLTDLINKGMSFENVRNAYILTQAVSKIIENLKDKLTNGNDVANMDKTALTNFKTLVNNIKDAVDNLLKDGGNLETVAGTFKTNFDNYVNSTNGKLKVSNLKSDLENNFDSSVQLSKLDIDDTIEKPGDNFDNIKQAVKDAVNNTDGEKYITDDITNHQTKFEKYDNWLTFMENVEGALKKYQQDFDNDKDIQKAEKYYSNWGKKGGFDYYIEKQADEAWDTFVSNLDLKYFNKLMSQENALQQKAAQYSAKLQEAIDADDKAAIEKYNSLLEGLAKTEASIQSNLNAWFNDNFLNKSGTLKKKVEDLYKSLDNDGDGTLDSNVYSKILEKYEKEALLGLYGLEKELISQIAGKLDTKPADNQLDAVSDLNTLDVKLKDGTTLSDLPADLVDIDVGGTPGEIESGEIPEIDLTT